SASAATYITASHSVVVASGQVTTQDFGRTSARGSIRGTVSDVAAVGDDVTAGIPGATVSDGVDAPVTTSGDGTYVITGVAPGSYMVSVLMNGYAPQSAPVTVTPATATTQDFALTALPGSISGIVTD